MSPAEPQLLSATLAWIDLAGIAVFAVSGALVAARKHQTLVTFAFFALATGVGGGTVRDLLIGAPVFWVRDSLAALACMAAALLVWLAPARWLRGKVIDWFDAVGIAAYAVFGTNKALAFGIDPVPAAMMGVITGCAGGIIRDVLANEPSILMRPEIYVTAIALAAGSYVILLALGMAALPAAVIASLAGFGLRAVAIAKGLALPGYGLADERRKS